MRWQAVQQESQRLSRIFTLEPYEVALKSFEKEYVSRLSERAGMDTVKMSQRSGLTAEFIENTVKDS